MPRMPIQDEPESTIGRKPAELAHDEPHAPPVPRSSASLRRALDDEHEAAAEAGDRERSEPEAGE